MFGKFLLRIFVGIIVATLVSAGKVLQLIAVAVVCTAGVGLIVVLPAAYLIGLVCTIWFIPFGEGSWEYDKRTDVKDSSLGRSTLLSNYIESAAAKGQDQGTIKADLIQIGWPEETVNAALKIKPATKDYNY